MDANEEIRRRLAVFFQNDATMVDKYLARFGPHLSMQNVQVLRSESAGTNAGTNAGTQRSTASSQPSKAQSPQATTCAVPTSSHSHEAPGEHPNLGDDPLFELKVECPICHKAQLPFKELRAKSLLIYSDQFTAPLYAPAHGYKRVNYALEAVCVCPKCGYASPDRKDFHYMSPYTKDMAFANIQPIVSRELVDSMGERLTILEDDPCVKELFVSPRTPRAGILSWRLALLRTEVERRNGVALAWFKSGFYWLRIASIERQEGADDLASLDMALSMFEECFRRSDNNGPTLEFQTLYILGALYLRKGDRKLARQYWGLLEKVKQEAEQKGAAATKAAVQPWIERCGQLWENREEPDAWDIPKGPAN